MFQYNLKVALRTLWRNKGFSLLNIAGLGIGLTVALLIGLWIADELSFDRFHKKGDRLYQVNMSDYVNGQLETWNSVPLAMAEELRKSFPEVRYVAEADWGWQHGLKYKDQLFFKSGLQVDDDFLKMFSFPLVAGSVENALDAPNSIVLTKEMAESLFGHKNWSDMLGEVVRVDNYYNQKVTGVLENVPFNSSLSFNYLLPFSIWEDMDWVKDSRNNWGNNSFQMFIELQPGVDGPAFAAKVKDLIRRNNKESKADVTLHALADWRLRSEFKNGQVAGGYIEYVRLFGIIGLFVLLIACVNFMNLSTARSERRSKEVGVRKTLGSVRGQLIGQFLGEALLMAGIAMILSLLLLELVLPGFNLLTKKELSTPYGSPVFWALTLGFTTLAGLLAGSYPAVFLSSFQPIKVLKGTFSGVGKAALLPRKVLVVSQFSVSIALIVSTLVVSQQIRHAKSRPLGYDPDRVVMVVMSGDLLDNYLPLKNEMLASGLVTGVTKAGSPVTNIYSNNKGVEWSGKDPGDEVIFATIPTSEDYFTTLGMTLKEGRFFSSDFKSDSTAIIFNESAIQRMGLENPLEETVQWQDMTFRIVGVVKDVVMSNPYEKVGPAMFLSSPLWASDMMFRLNPEVDTRQALAQLEPMFKKHNPAYPFDYTFADEFHSRKFATEELIGKLAGIFAGLAIFISCLGLFGLSAYMAERRTKEIGIRKVLGASVSNLWALLSKEFVGLVLVSAVVAAPTAAWFLKDWLEKFEYRIGLTWWVFIAAGVMAVVGATLVVALQTVRAALANPVKSLRSE